MPRTEPHRIEVDYNWTQPDDRVWAITEKGLAFGQRVLVADFDPTEHTYYGTVTGYKELPNGDMAPLLTMEW